MNEILEKRDHFTGTYDLKTRTFHIGISTGPVPLFYPENHNNVNNANKANLSNELSFMDGSFAIHRRIV